MSMNQIIKKMAVEAVRSMGTLEFIEAEVHSSPPDIRLKLKGNKKLIIPSSFIIIPEHLTRRVQTVNISSSNISESMTLAGDPSHSHDLQSITMKNVEIEYLDELKKGDKVMVAAIQGGQTFFIIDRF
ncbi:DUF2577 family protein [Oceanobacillus sp. CF4.6]|uniref:DUF2577 family protein n=1 Tax=Oceanobacillus sp. CF4.6 TaxID=3373080 RepID=UPI003EE76681